MTQLQTRNQMKKLAKSELILIIAPSELKQIKNCGTAKEWWDKLKQTYASKGPPSPPPISPLKLKKRRLKTRVNEDLRYALIIRQYEKNLRDTSEELFKNLFDNMSAMRAESTYAKFLDQAKWGMWETRTWAQGAKTSAYKTCMITTILRSWRRSSWMKRIANSLTGRQ